MELNYDWSKYPQVIEFINNIHVNTLKSLMENDCDTRYASEIVSDIEDYIYYLKIHNYNVNGVIAKLSDIDSVQFFDSLVVGDGDNITYPPVFNRYTKIMLNSNITGDKRLSARERRKLYLYKGLSKSLMRMQSTKTIEFSKIFSDYLTSSRSSVESIVNNGWLLLEDCLSQELAEKITYFSLDKIRPGYRVGLENELFQISGCKVSSNLEMDRPFQALIVNVGLTIGKLANCYDYSEGMIINDLLRNAINRNLSNIIISEYNEKRNHLELYRLLYLMGLLVNEKYRIYHMSFIHELDLSEKDCNMIYDNIIEITDRLISFENKDYEDTNLFGIVYDKDTRDNVLKLVRYHEI